MNEHDNERKRKPDEHDNERKPKRQAEEHNNEHDNEHSTKNFKHGEEKHSIKFKQAANKVIIANRFRVHRSEEEEQELEKIYEFQKHINPDELLEKIKSNIPEAGIKDDYIRESRGLIKTFFSAISKISNMIAPSKPPESSTISRTPTANISHHAPTHTASNLNNAFIHPPLPKGWTEINDLNVPPAYPPIFIDEKGNQTYDRPYLPLKSLLKDVPSVFSNIVSCTIIGHGGLVRVVPRLFSPGPMCHVRYFSPFANPVMANYIDDINGYTLQLPNTSGLPPRPAGSRPASSTQAGLPDYLREYEDDFDNVYERGYNQEKSEVTINPLRKKTTDSVTCLNKSFSFLEKINLQGLTPAQIEYEEGMQRINEANFGVYIMRNNMGIVVGHKLDITGLPGYPDNVLFQDILGLITFKLRLDPNDRVVVLDPTCNAAVYKGDTDSEKRFISRNYEQIIEEINKNPNETSDAMSLRLSLPFRSVFTKGGSKRRKQKKTRKNKKQKTKKNKKNVT